MADYTGFFLNSDGGLIPLECIEINHSSFSEPFRYIKNNTDGMTLADNWYDYIPMQIQRKNVTNDLDQTMSITIADMEGTLIKSIMDIQDSAFATEYPSFKYKVFRSDDLTEPMTELQTLEVATVSKDSTGLVTFDAKAPELNSVKTGVIYNYDEFPLLRGI